MGAAVGNRCWVGDPVVQLWEMRSELRSYCEAVEVQQRVQQWVQQSNQRNAYLLLIL